MSPLEKVAARVLAAQARRVCPTHDLTACLCQESRAYLAAEIARAVAEDEGLRATGARAITARWAEAKGSPLASANFVLAALTTDPEEDS